MSGVANSFSGALAALNSRDLKWAEQLFRRVVKSDKANVPALNLLAVVLMSMERFAEAEPFIARATSINQKSDASFYNYGLISKRLNKPQQALENFNKAIALNPNVAETWNNRGTVFNDLEKYDCAIADFDQAISLNGGLGEAYANKGKALSLLRRHAEALSAYDKVLSINPHLAEAWFGRGNVLCDLRCYDEAFAAYDKTLSIKPELESVEGARLHTKMRLCKWDRLEEELARLTTSVRSGRASCGPFALLSLLDSPDDHLRCAQAWVAAKSPRPSRSVWQGRIYHHDKIRIGYVSSDFNRHATAYLIAELFELHDRTRFELFAYSIGPNDESDIRKRLTGAFDKFVTCEDRPDVEVARAIEGAEIDILIDLNGFTKGARTNIFAHRPAPIQVNYLGYPGTMAAPYVDYIIGDRTILTSSDTPAYSEKLVQLPYSYQPNDRKRPSTGKSFTRDDLGLPAEKFVFCCFNNSYKILPDVFECWMRILKAAEGGVLWLLAEDQTAVANLRREAEIRGVDPARLVFAGRLEVAEHLARHRLADLFLDTLPYNAHTTASDALWMGLPVLTQIGGTFAGRVAASLLKAIRLPELIARTSDEYESIAIELARNPAKLAAIKRKLEENRLTAPLFDTKLLAGHIETAYQMMYDRYQAGLAPDHIVVPA
ncbi:tetratricopeptide repeat protein [Bradyrhizobium erythrophlei]|uniref:tetratricopeptide repeat protein n=1 Tax=Bradyrhizobium erythrophlei TaxID=1437360 RepID=UPI0035E93B61